MRYINVRSTFRENNPEFASARDAIEFSREHSRQSGLAFPDSETLTVNGYRFSDDTLCLRFTNNMSLSFAIEEGHLIGNYLQTDQECESIHYREADHCFGFRFPHSDKVFEWNPVTILKVLVNKELLDWFVAPNRYYLYFEDMCVSVSILRDEERGRPILYWENAA
jgi:hypothetical protein